MCGNPDTCEGDRAVNSVSPTSGAALEHSVVASAISTAGACIVGSSLYIGSAVTAVLVQLRVFEFFTHVVYGSFTLITEIGERHPRNQGRV